MKKLLPLFILLDVTISSQSFSSDKIPAASIIRAKTHHRVMAAKQQSPSITGAVLRLLNYVENNIIKAAEAMPEEKFNFTPEKLAIAGSEFGGVRSFAAQIKHLATDNFDIWNPLLGTPLRSDITDVNGPENIKTKADVIKYLKESFADGHKAIATLTEKNAMEQLPFRGSTLPRLDLAFYALTHAQEHYGQMVVYLRMCGVVPPASRGVK